jgi:undecaprenyl-diphosphatase
MPLWLKALLLGVVEGATEFLPISSTGHLIIASEWIDYPQASRATFEIFIQLGAILAVFWHYRRPLLDLGRDLPRQSRARALAAKVLLAFLPAAFVGLLLHDWIEANLFSVPSVALALVAGGAVILLIERRRWRPLVLEMDEVRWSDAVWVGLAQIASLYPGVSRAGATIMGGLLAGMSRPASTQFSFYLALPTITAASLFSLLKRLSDLGAGDVVPLAVGFLSAFASALLVIRAFLRFVQTHDFRAFGWYRIAFGLALLALG